MQSNRDISAKIRRQRHGVWWQGLFFPYDIHKLRHLLAHGQVPFDPASRISYLSLAVRLFHYLDMIEQRDQVKHMLADEVQVARDECEVKRFLDELSHQHLDERSGKAVDAQPTSPVRRLVLPLQSQHPPEQVPFSGVFRKPDTNVHFEKTVSDIFPKLGNASFIDMERSSLSDFKTILGYRDLGKHNPNPIVWIGDINALAYFILQLERHQVIAVDRNRWRIVSTNFIVAKLNGHPTTRSLRQSQSRPLRQSVRTMLDKTIPLILSAH